VLRPTWHFVAPADIRWMLALTGPRVMSRMAPYNRQLELDGATFAKSRKVLERSLRDGQHLTRAELATALERAGVGAQGPRLAHLVMDAELQGIICSGPRRRNQFTYALIEERAAPAPSLTREEALAELVRRYFTSHGPATIRDFVWWSGLTTADARAGLAMLGSAVCDEVIEGVTCWSHEPSPVPSARPLPPVAHLLPNYDEYLIAYRDRGFSVSAGGLTFDDFYAHFLTINGLLAGTWRRVITKDTVTITVRTRKPLSRSDRALVEAAAGRHAKFMERGVELRYS
jgi:winged helix DNA-binding protein